MKRRLLLMCLILPLAPAVPAGADTPPGRYTVSADTVKDERTGLTWQRTVAGTYTQSGAVSYCAGLALAGGGWRLPAVSELLTLVDPTMVNPAIDATAFPSTPVDPFWSSSAAVGVSGNVWRVDFNFGNSWPLVTSSAVRVRCVR